MWFFTPKAEVESVCGFRDVGGKKNADLKLFKPRALFRSAEYDHITSKDLETLTGELAVKSVIDFRAPEQIGAGAIVCALFR
jgi:hypothetical protein